MVMTQTEYQFGELESMQSFKCFPYTFDPLAPGVLQKRKLFAFSFLTMHNHWISKTRQTEKAPLKFITAAQIQWLRGSISVWPQLN